MICYHRAGFVSLILCWVSPIKRIVFYSFIILVNYLLIELLAYGLFRLVLGEYDRSSMQLERIQAIKTIESGPVFTGENTQNSDSSEVRKVREILHPYFGYTVEGRLERKGCDLQQELAQYKCYERILLADDKPFPKRDKNSLNVALLGGSVAAGTIHGTEHQTYEKLLGALPEYKGKKINMHMLAAGGYRLPQPLMMLNYYISLGAEYDLVISLDGFNEIAIASSEYHAHKVHPSFPRAWQFRISGRVSPDLIKLQARRLLIQDKHKFRATTMSNPWFRNSALSNFLWKLVQRNYATNLAQNNSELEQIQKSDDIPREFQYEGLGPEYDFKGWDQFFDYAAQIWANGNLLAHSATEINGGKFFHFIQPNQYVEGAKPLMTKRERSIAFVAKEQSGYGYWYKKGYPAIVSHQQRLKDKGVNTTDLTFMFKDTPDEIYIDNCCHLNSKGSHRIIEKIIETIHQYNIAQASVK